MDYAGILLILRIISEAVGAAKEVDSIIKRVERGDVITDEEIRSAQADVKAAVERWKGQKT